MITHALAVSVILKKYPCIKHFFVNFHNNSLLREIKPMNINLSKFDLLKYSITRPIAISRMLQAISDVRTDRPTYQLTDRLSDRPTD